MRGAKLAAAAQQAGVEAQGPSAKAKDFGLLRDPAPQGPPRVGPCASRKFCVRGLGGSPPKSPGGGLILRLRRLQQFVLLSF